MATATRQTPPQSARRHYALSALLAQRAVTDANKARSRGPVAVLRALVTHQATAARLSERAVAEMLLEQEIDARADAMLNALAFTTDARTFTGMTGATSTQAEFDRIVESLVQDAARAAESVATAVRPDIYHIRYVSPPCCARCAVLAGRVYRWSDGFLRHPNCSCTMLPTTVAAPFAQSPESLFENGQVRGLSKADTQAVRDGADLGRVVNVRKKAAGLKQSGRVLARAGKPTPEGIYKMAPDRETAVSLLVRYGYVR